MNQRRDPPRRNEFLRGESDSNLYAFKQSAGLLCDAARGARSLFCRVLTWFEGTGDPVCSEMMS